MAGPFPAEERRKDSPRRHRDTEMEMKRKYINSVPPCLRGERNTMKKRKASLPLAAPRHRMVVAADVWLKKAGRGHDAASCPLPSGKK